MDLDGPDNILGNEDDEECDDGNTVHGDGCSETCTNEFCGDGFVDTDGLNQKWGDNDDEHCDDGNTDNGDGCSSLCKYEFCGDGIVDSDGPDNDALTIEDNEYCDEGRFCDDGRSCTHDPYLCIDECRPRMTDTCTDSCTIGFCGDGYADADGPNNILGDTDDEQCDAGSFCPNGVVCTNDESLCP